MCLRELVKRQRRMSGKGTCDYASPIRASQALREKSAPVLFPQMAFVINTFY